MTINKILDDISKKISNNIIENVKKLILSGLTYLFMNNNMNNI